MAVKKMSEWMNCGTMGTADNEIAETTTDAGFRKIEAIDTSAGLNLVAYNDVEKTLTIQDGGKYLVNMFIKFSGSAKIFEFCVFIDGAESLIKINDRAAENTHVSPVVDLPAGAVLDLRQRTLDGGTALTINTCGLSIARQV